MKVKYAKTGHGGGPVPWEIHAQNLWLRSEGRSEEVEQIEKHTGIQAIIAGGFLLPGRITSRRFRFC